MIKAQSTRTRRNCTKYKVNFETTTTVPMNSVITLDALNNKRATHF